MNKILLNDWVTLEDLIAKVSGLTGTIPNSKSVFSEVVLGEYNLTQLKICEDEYVYLTGNSGLQVGGFNMEGQTSFLPTQIMRCISNLPTNQAREILKIATVGSMFYGVRDEDFEDVLKGKEPSNIYLLDEVSLGNLNKFVDKSIYYAKDEFRTSNKVVESWLDLTETKRYRTYMDNSNLYVELKDYIVKVPEILKPLRPAIIGLICFSVVTNVLDGFEYKPNYDRNKDGIAKFKMDLF